MTGKMRAPYAPFRLDGEAKTAWRRVAKGMIDVGLWHDLYRSTLEILCVTYSHWLDAEQRAQEAGPDQDLHRQEAETYLDQVRGMVKEFGTSQAERADVAHWLAGDALADLLRGLLFAPVTSGGEQ